MADFANILFAGPCNRACPWCIGQLLPDRVNVDNLDLFPPRGIDAFVEAVRQTGTREVVFTGTISDPQLYRHEARLLAHLRERLPAEVRYAVHTNGVKALERMDVFNRYDRACLSIPSFVPATYERMMGSRRVPDVTAILRAARIPVKISCVLDDPNAAEVPGFLAECRRLGVRRVVLRTLHGDRRRWDVLSHLPVVGEFRGNPVHDLDGMEVTLWDFERSALTSLNLFPDGTLGTSYLLTRTPELAEAG